MDLLMFHIFCAKNDKMICTAWRYFDFSCFEKEEEGRISNWHTFVKDLLDLKTFLLLLSGMLKSANNVSKEWFWGVAFAFLFLHKMWETSHSEYFQGMTWHESTLSHSGEIKCHVNRRLCPPSTHPPGVLKMRMVKKFKNPLKEMIQQMTVRMVTG